MQVTADLADTRMARETLVAQLKEIDHRCAVLADREQELQVQGCL